MKIIGGFGMKMHDKKVSNCRAYCKMYQTRTEGGRNGPTAFVMKFKRIKTGYIDKILNENGAKHGSKVAMTENAFMTEEAWMELTPKLIERYQAMPFIRNNPQWHVIEIFVVFGAQLCNQNSLQMRLDANIIRIKEKGDLFSINQDH